MTISEFVENRCGLNFKCVIYKFTNIHNNKVYIGQTKNSLHKRLISHISQSRKNTINKKHHLQHALQKYGTTGFNIEVIECCNIDDLNSREIYWISYYDSTNPVKGYNCTKGDDGCPMAREINEITRKLISEKNKKLWANIEYKERQRDARIKSHKNRCKPIVQLTYSYELIKIWDQKKDINEKFGGTIYKLNKSRKLLLMGGYIWMYATDYNNLFLGDPLLVQLDDLFEIVATFYDYRSANIRIYELSGFHGRLLFDINQKRTKLNGTKRAGYTWMLYSRYTELKKY